MHYFFLKKLKNYIYKPCQVLADLVSQALKSGKHVRPTLVGSGN